MELGNLAFGNSRGTFPIDRGEGWEEELDRLFKATDPKFAECQAYKNDTFEIFTYYWGDCSCGWDNINNEQEKLNNLEHLDTCYRNDYKRLTEEAKAKHKWLSEPYDAYMFDKIIDLYKKHNLKYNKDNPLSGCAIRCSCDYPERYENVINGYEKEFGFRDHKENCLLLKPNFKHFKTEFEIQWYKYPLRDSYMNVDISLDAFKKIIDNCIESITDEYR